MCAVALSTPVEHYTQLLQGPSIGSLPSSSHSYSLFCFSLTSFYRKIILEKKKDLNRNYPVFLPLHSDILHFLLWSI